MWRPACRAIIICIIGASRSAGDALQQAAEDQQMDRGGASAEYRKQNETGETAEKYSPCVDPITSQPLWQRQRHARR